MSEIIFNLLLELPYANLKEPCNSIYLRKV